MANNILSSATFTASNMKPVPDEQIDALWGQNLSDNTGYLRARPIPLLHIPEHTSIQHVSGIEVHVRGTYASLFNQVVYRPKGHNTLNLSIVGSIFHDFNDTPDNNGTFVFRLCGDLGTYSTNHTYSISNTSDYPYATTLATALSFTSYVSEGSFAKMQIDVCGSSLDRGAGTPEGTLVYAVGTSRTTTSWV